MIKENRSVTLQAEHHIPDYPLCSIGIYDSEPGKYYMKILGDPFGVWLTQDEVMALRDIFDAALVTSP